MNVFHFCSIGDTASREPDRESASNTGVAGASITGSMAGSMASSSYVAMKVGILVLFISCLASSSINKDVQQANF